MFQYHYRFNYFSSRIPVLSYVLKPLIAQPQARILEVGSFEGRSACWFLTEILTGAGASLTCIDPWLPYPELVEEEREHLEHHAEAYFDHNARVAAEQSGALVYKLKGRSDEILPKLPPENFDAIYLDGSHRAKDVLSDLVLGWRLLKIGGVMICDDYLYDRYLDPLWTPKTAIDAFLNCYRHYYQLLQQNQLVILRKVDGETAFAQPPPLSPSHSPY